MAKKFDYQKNVITIDEAMEMLGFSNVDKFVSIVDKHIPSHKIDGDIDMYSISEVRSLAKALDKELFIPDEVKERCVMFEKDIPPEKKEEEPIKRRIEHPYMEGVKCLENCFHKDEYGICKCSSKCVVYDVELAPKEDVPTRINRTIELKRADEFKQKQEFAQSIYEDGTAKISAVQDILMKQLYAMTAPNLTQDERDAAIKTGLAVSNVSKTVLTSFGLQLQSFELASQYGIDKKGVKKLI